MFRDSLFLVFMICVGGVVGCDGYVYGFVCGLGFVGFTFFVVGCLT